MLNARHVRPNRWDIDKQNTIVYVLFEIYVNLIGTVYLVLRYAIRPPPIPVRTFDVRPRPRSLVFARRRGPVVGRKQKRAEPVQRGRSAASKRRARRREEGGPQGKCIITDKRFRQFFLFQKERAETRIYAPHGTHPSEIKGTASGVHLKNRELPNVFPDDTYRNRRRCTA